MSTSNAENPLFRCQKCNRFVPPIKRPALFFLLIPGLWIPYLIYYSFFKSPECVYCGYQFKRSELKPELEESMGDAVE